MGNTKVLRNLKSNRACGHDQIINDFLKASTGKMTDIRNVFI